MNCQLCGCRHAVVCSKSVNGCLQLRKSETPMSKRQIGGVQAQPRNSYAATPTVSRLQRRTSLAAILAAAGGEKEKKPSGTPVPGAASTAKLHSVVVNDAATKTRPTASAGSFDRNLPRRFVSTYVYNFCRAVREFLCRRMFLPKNCLFNISPTVVLVIASGHVQQVLLR